MSDSCVPDSELYNLRHSTAHLMAQAIGELFPGVKYAIGPPIEDGFLLRLRSAASRSGGRSAAHRGEDA